MPVKHVLEITFSSALVQKPGISTMIREHDVVVNVGNSSIHQGQGHANLHVIGEASEVTRAEQFLRDAGAYVRVCSSEPYEGDLPDVPSADLAPSGAPVVSRKLWLTFTGDLIGRPVLWEMARRFGVEFDIRQSSIGEKVGIIGLLLRGPETRLEAAREFLESIGAEVEPIEKSVVEG